VSIKNIFCYIEFILHCISQDNLIDIIVYLKIAGNGNKSIINIKEQKA